MSTDTIVTPTLDTTSTESSTRFIGRVKWFNTKTGYGFITVTDGPKSGSDIFVHHSAVVVSSEQYKYLVQGEYVEFKLIHTVNGAHEYQAGDVSGIKGGKLMCETRREFRDIRNTYNDDEQAEPAKTPRSVRPPRERETKTPRQPREEQKDQDKTWSYVASGRSTSSGRGEGQGRGQGRGQSQGRGGASSRGRGAPKARLEL